MTDITWIPAGDYTLKLEGMDILVHNAKGAQVKTMPAKVKKTEAFEQLDSLWVFMAQHAVTYRDTVRTWFLSGMSVPVTVITAAWPDENPGVDNCRTCSSQQSAASSRQGDRLGCD